MDLLQELLALTELHIYQIKDLLQMSRRSLEDASREGLSTYQQIVVVQQIDELQRYRLRQFRMLNFLFCLTHMQQNSASSMPLYLYTPPLQVVIASPSPESSVRSSSSDAESSSNVSPSLENQYIMFALPFRGIAHYRAEYVINLLAGNVMLSRRHRRRFLLPHRIFYLPRDDITCAFIPLKEYVVLLPLVTTLNNFMKARYHLFSNIFCHILKEVLDLLAILHGHGIVLNGEFLHLCIDRLSGRVRLNLCTYSVPIPISFHAGVTSDLRAVIDIIHTYTEDQSLYMNTEVYTQLVQIAHSIQKAINQEFGEDGLVISDLMDVAKCLALHPVFFSNAYPCISIISTDIVEVFRVAQQITHAPIATSVDILPGPSDAFLESLRSTDISIMPQSHVEASHTQIYGSQYSISPTNRLLFESSAITGNTIASHLQTPESSLLRGSGRDSTDLRFSLDSLDIAPLLDTHVNLEINIKTPPQPLPRPQKISERYVYSIKKTAELRKDIANQQAESISPCTCKYEQCLSATKVPVVTGPVFPAYAACVVESDLPCLSYERVPPPSPPQYFRGVTTLHIDALSDSPAKTSSTRRSTQSARGRASSFGGSALTHRASSHPVQPHGYDAVVGEQRRQQSATPPKKTTYVLNMGGGDVLRKKVPVPYLRQQPTMHLSKPLPNRPRSTSSIVTVPAPQFAPSFRAGPRRISYTVAHQLSQDEVANDILTQLSSQAPVASLRRNSLPGNLPLNPRTLSQPPPHHTVDPAADMDILYSRVTLHAPRFAAPERRVYIERNLPTSVHVHKEDINLNPLEELNKALVDFC